MITAWHVGPERYRFTDVLMQCVHYALMHYTFVLLCCAVIGDSTAPQQLVWWSETQPVQNHQTQLANHSSGRHPEEEHEAVLYRAMYSNNHVNTA